MVRKMYFVNRIIVRAIFILSAVIYVNSVNPANTSAAEKSSTKARDDESTASSLIPPHYFPQNASDPPTKFHSLTRPLCWLTVSAAFFSQNLHTPQNHTRQQHRSLRNNFTEQVDKFNEHLLGLIRTADDIRMLLMNYSNLYNVSNLDDSYSDSSNKENKTNQTEAPVSKKINSSNTVPDSSRDSKKTTTSTRKDVLQEATTTSSTRIIKDVPNDDSNNPSVTVPILLIVILMLLMYIAFLYRKLQFASSYRRYKDREILIQDELTDPWAPR